MANFCGKHSFFGVERGWGGEFFSMGRVGGGGVLAVVLTNLHDACRRKPKLPRPATKWYSRTLIFH